MEETFCVNEPGTSNNEQQQTLIFLPRRKKGNDPPNYIIVSIFLSPSFIFSGISLNYLFWSD